MSDSADEMKSEEYAGEARPEMPALCPICGAPLISEKCKLICRSETCVYRIVFNCAEF